MGKSPLSLDPHPGMATLAEIQAWEQRNTRSLEAVSVSLPDDMADAFESMKLAILRNKADGWREVSADMTIGALWELQRLAMAESKADSNPF